MVTLTTLLQQVVQGDMHAVKKRNGDLNSRGGGLGLGGGGLGGGGLGLGGGGDGGGGEGGGGLGLGGGGEAVRKLKGQEAPHSVRHIYICMMQRAHRDDLSLDHAGQDRRFRQCCRLRVRGQPFPGHFSWSTNMPGETGHGFSRKGRKWSLFSRFSLQGKRETEPMLFVKGSIWDRQTDKPSKQKHW